VIASQPLAKKLLDAKDIKEFLAKFCPPPTPVGKEKK
jgi:hypothetical protein